MHQNIQVFGNVSVCVGGCTLTDPTAVLPPVCLEWPLFSQLMEGEGCPETRHSSTTRAPTGTVNTSGHILTDGGAAGTSKKKEISVQVQGQRHAASPLRRHTQHS